MKIANRYRSRGVKTTDLIQEGNVGLMRAVERFDPEQGGRLVSYAVWWIRSAIQDYTLKSFSLVKIGTTIAQRRLFFALARTRRELARPGGERGIALDGGDELARIAERLCVKRAEVEEMSQRLGGRDASLDAPTGDEGEGTLSDSLAAHGPSQEQALAAEQTGAMVRGRIGEALALLRERERYVIEQRAMSDDPLTLAELGERLGVSTERVRQLEARAKGKLRRELSELAAEVGWPTVEQGPRRVADDGFAAAA